MSFFGRTYPQGSLFKWAQVNECCRKGLAEQFSGFNTHMAGQQTPTTACYLEHKDAQAGESQYGTQEVSEVDRSVMETSVWYFRKNGVGQRRK